MVDFKHILNNRNCPTLDWIIRDNIEMTKKDEEQEYGEFPPRDSLFEREDLDFYENNPILKKLMEHYLPFFEKGIDYVYEGKTRNVYPTGSLLWYCNEAFSLCTKLSIDPSPEHYFVDEYYYDIGGECTPIERYLVLSIFYALLAVNWKVRRQHLKMVDVLFNFLSKRCPLSVMTKCLDFINETYEPLNAIDYDFRPAIDCYGYTRLKVDEGLPNNDEEQRDLFVQMKMKVFNNWKKYAEMIHIKPTSNLPEELLTDEAQHYWTKLRENGFIVAYGYGLAEGVSDNQAAYIASCFGEKLGIKPKWKPFIQLWGKPNLAQLAGNWKETGKYPPRAKGIDDIFGVKPEKPKNYVKLK